MSSYVNRLSNLSNRAVLFILIAVALWSSAASFIVNVVNNVDTTPGWWVSWLQNFSTEMFGAFLTFILLTLVVETRQEKERLIRQMRSSINEEAIRAVEELRAHGWLKDGSLRGINLMFANLQGAELNAANLQGAKLNGAKLQGADLVYANLQGADLAYAEFDENTFLPDDTKWTLETDMHRFTDPAHPQFWRSYNRYSPAYRGKGEG